jgi:hypothetical protein
MLDELILKSDFLVHPPACHRLFESSKAIDKKPNLNVGKMTNVAKMLPPPAKSYFATQKLNLKNEKK